MYAISVGGDVARCTSNMRMITNMPLASHTHFVVYAASKLGEQTTPAIVTVNVAAVGTTNGDAGRGKGKDKKGN